MEDDDEIIDVLPIHFSNRLDPFIQLHQFPLLTRPLQVPPAAAASGKRIAARIKPKVRRLEIHVPADPRPDVWNIERAKSYGAARVEDDKERNQDQGERDADARLSDARLKSEKIPERGNYVLGIVRDGHLHLHPIQETHQFRPTLTYLDVLFRRNRPSRGVASDSEDEVAPGALGPVPAPVVKREKKAVEAKEVQVSARRADGLATSQSGLSAARRELLHAIRAEEDERWESMEYCDANSAESETAIKRLSSQNSEELICQSDMSDYIKMIEGL